MSDKLSFSLHTNKIIYAMAHIIEARITGAPPHTRIVNKKRLTRIITILNIGGKNCNIYHKKTINIVILNHDTAIK